MNFQVTDNICDNSSHKSKRLHSDTRVIKFQFEIFAKPYEILRKSIH